MHEQGAQGWCTGMTLRDGMGREVGGRVRMGNTCTPMADLFECMAKNLAAKQQQQPIRPRQHFTEFRVYTRRGSRKVEQDSTFF